MDIERLIKGIMIFLLGCLSMTFVFYYLNYGLEVPSSLGAVNVFNLTGAEKTPGDSVDDNLIKVFDDRVVIYIDDASLSYYAPTGSMKPVLDENSNGIRVKVNDVDEIEVGDIISFKKDSISIVHRVVDKGVDGKGVYFVTKGDNNEFSDGKIRFEDIKYKTVGVIW